MSNRIYDEDLDFDIYYFRKYQKESWRTISEMFGLSISTIKTSFKRYIKNEKSNIDTRAMEFDSAAYLGFEIREDIVEFDELLDFY